MEYLDNIIETTLNSFDFSFCIVVNAFTYAIIKYIDEIRTKKLSVWQKRLILILTIFSTGGLYILLGCDTKLILNSAMIAPVSWSWIFKPLCSKFNIDYKKLDNGKE